MAERGAWGANMVTGLDLVTSPDKEISGFNLAFTPFLIHRAFKISTLESGFEKLRIRMPHSPDTCGRGNFRIRKEKVADSKISE